MLKINSVEAYLNLDKWQNIGAEGKNSDVWICRDTQLEEMLVVKEISKESLDRQNVKDYFLEAKLINDSSHPNIMPIRYAVQDEYNVYLTMPFYKRGSIESEMKKEMLIVRNILKYALEFLSGLLFVHIKNTIHLDIKPSNILIDNSGKAVLTDFGLSRYLNEGGFIEQDITYLKHATPQYYETKERSRADDIYQAGLTLYRMCNGNSDYKKQYETLVNNCNKEHELIYNEIKKAEFPNRNSYLPHIPRRLITIINKMLKVDISIRYSNVLQIINDLSKVEKYIDWKMHIYKTAESEIYIWELNKNTSVYYLTIEMKKDKEILTWGIKYVKKSRNTLQLRKVRKEHASIEHSMKFIEEMIKEYS